MHPFSRGRINYLARELLSAIQGTRSVTLLRDRDAVLQAIAAALTEEFKREEEREENVRRRIASIQRPPARSSKEYEELFERLMQEEYVREGLEG